MNIKPFKVEQWMNTYENDVRHNLGETCIDSLTLRELLELAGENPNNHMAALADKRLTYGHIEGSPDLLSGIAKLYKGLKPTQIVPTHGAIGANHMVLLVLLNPSDNMVSVMPTYQQHYSIPESIGTEVRPLQLSFERDFLPDLDELRSLVDSNTKLITINNPNNPTGSWINPAQMQAVIDIAKSVDAYVLSDEVYRGISEDGSYMPSIVDLYDKGISVGSMSKIFSLAGLRIGWIASKSHDVIRACLERRDYDTISLGVLDDHFASLALAHKDAIFDRNRKILNTNREILDQWVNETVGVRYLKPVAGTTALVYYDKDIPSAKLCDALAREKSLLFVPGSCFEMEGCVRIGYAFDSKLLRKGLDLFAEYLKAL